MTLRLVNLSMGQGKRILLSSLSRQFSPGSISTIMGPNGVGKSTLLTAMAGIHEPASGKVLLNGQNVFELACLQRARLMASVAQFETAPEGLSVRDRIALGLAPVRGFNALLDSKTNFEIERLAERLGIPHLLDRRVGSLSGGEKKRVHVARALINQDAEVFILDEPFAGVHVEHHNTLAQVLQELRSKEKIVVLAAHEHPIAQAISDEILELAPMPT